MSQHDMDIANQTFPSTRIDLNLALKSLASTSKGNARPSTIFGGQLWVDDDHAANTWRLYIHDGVDDIPLFDINTSTNTAGLAGGAAVIQALLAATTEAAARTAIGINGAGGVIALGDLSGAITTLIAQQAAPSGLVAPFAGAVAPSGWLICNGQEVSRTTYAALDAAIGTTYGAYTNGAGGAGTTHFRVPDLRGRVVAGLDGGAGRLTTIGGALGNAGGAQTHVLSVGEIPSHQHSQTYAGQFLSDVTGAGATTWSGIGGTNTGAAGGGGAHNNVQPTMVLNYIIKT